METNLEIQNAEEYENRGNKAIAAVEAITVVDDTTNKIMGDTLAKVKQGMKVIKSKIDEPIDNANKLHKWLTGIRAKILAPWEQAESIAKKRMADYAYKLMCERREAQQKADEERRRLEEEQARQANAAIAAKKPDQAAAILKKEVETKTVVPDAPKTEKQTAAFTYDFEVVDANLIPDEFWVIDYQRIGAQVKRDKLACKIAGIKVIESAMIRSR